MKVVCHFDGGVRQKGTIGAGAAVVYDETGTELAARAHYMTGKVTSNVAEYMGLILALATAIELGASDVDVLGDSELVVRQVNGAYACRAPTLQTLLILVQSWRILFDTCDVREFPRGGPRNKRRWGNDRADGLANQCMDKRRDIR